MSGVVTLIGLMGAGKSKVGRLAAVSLDRPFVDTDRLVEEATGTTVAEIFAVQGEAAFRQREVAAVRVALERRGSVVAVGGGAVLDDRNVARMRSAGPVIWLYAEPETLAQRLGKSLLRGDRPLLADDDPVAVLRGLLDRRRDAYASAATITLPTDGLAVEESAELLIDVIREHGA
ncbi:MAG TPA: shikimate kinase [Euzebyales bacterium]